MSDELTPQEIIKWALRWAWDNDMLTQQQAERGLDWIGEHDTQVSDMPDEQADHRVATS